MTKPKPQPYGRPKRRPPSTHVMTVLHPDALQAVTAVMTKHQLSRSGAIHHLVRLGAGLPPLN
jgi:hypothetical protein